MVGWRQTGGFAYFSWGPGTNERIPGQRGKCTAVFVYSMAGWGSDGKDGAGAFYSHYFYFHRMDAVEADLHLHIPPSQGDFIPEDGCAEMGKESM